MRSKYCKEGLGRGLGLWARQVWGVNPFLLSVVNAQKYEYHFYCKGGSFLEEKID